MSKRSISNARKFTIALLAVICVAISTTSFFVVQAAGELKIQYRYGDDVDDKKIKPEMKLVNTTGSAISLTNVKIRYWFTADDASTPTIYCDFATAGCSKLTQSIVAVSPSKTNADRYLEIGFTSTAGSIAADSDQTIKYRIQKSTDYNDANDHSYDATKTNYTDWNKITVYNNGILIWGNEPSGGGSSTPTPTPSATPTPTPTPTATPTPTPTPSPGGTVNVSNAAQLQAALNSATPGQTIVMANGTYSGNFVTTADGTEANKITLQGTRNAIINSGGTSSGYGLFLNGANHWRLLGFTVTNAQKGIMLDYSSYCLIDDVRVHNVGDEAIHFRRFSSYNTVQYSLITDTGKRDPEFGEGVYLGSSVNNWNNLTGGNADAANYNQVIGNVIGPDVTGEMIDIKEGTYGGLIQANTFHGDDLLGDPKPPDTWVDVKGNNYLITQNIGYNLTGDTLDDGYSVTSINSLASSGKNNVFSYNVCNVNGSGYGFKANSNTTGTIVYANNIVNGAASGFANITVTP